MSNEYNYEKQSATAPPPYTLNPTGNPQNSPYGFSIPSQPPPQQYIPQPQPGYPQQIPITITTQPPTNQTTVVVMGGCPSCRTGVLEDNYTCCGILCAICFFPIGILCCLAMKEKTCTHCHASF